MTSRTKKPVMRANTAEVASMNPSPLEPVALFASPSPFSERDQCTKWDDHPQQQYDKECNCVHDISFHSAPVYEKAMRK